MNVHQLQHILLDADPAAEVIISYHADAAPEGAFYEDDVSTFSERMDDTMGRPVFYLLTEGFCEAATALDQVRMDKMRWNK